MMKVLHGGLECNKDAPTTAQPEQKTGAIKLSTASEREPPRRVYFVTCDVMHMSEVEPRVHSTLEKAVAWAQTLEPCAVCDVDHGVVAIRELVIDGSAKSRIVARVIVDNTSTLSEYNHNPPPRIDD